MLVTSALVAYMVINYRRELIAKKLDDSGIHFLYARKFCRRPFQKSKPQSKVAVLFRLNVLYWYIRSV